MKSYRDFEIQISAAGAGHYAIVVSGPGGDARGAFDLPPADPAYQGLAARLARLETDETALSDLGQILFRMLFQGPIRDVYTRSQSALGPEEGMRLRLNVDLERELDLAALPWEFLCDPDRGPLAMLDAPVVRYLPQQAVVPSMATPLPIKIMLTGAHTPPPSQIARELDQVEQALAALGENVKIAVEPHLTAAKLRALLRQGFHVWHFIGHGRLSDDGRSGALCLEDPSGDVNPVSARELGILLQRSGLRLVVLNACNSGALTLAPLGSLAPALMRAQVPAVVAMQFSVPQDAARAFAGEFYGALAEGLPIDMCVTEGRKAIMDVAGLRSPDWGLPVVYTRAPDGKLFERPAAPAVALPPLVAPAAPATAQGYGQSAGEGLSALPALIAAAPPVQEAAVRFRADFQVACEQIELLGDYKDIHDQLHLLQFNCYNCIVQEIRRAGADQLAWDALLDYELTCQNVLGRLQELSAQAAPAARPGRAPGVARATLSAQETAWVADLAAAHHELHGAVESCDAAQLKRSIRMIGRVLMTQPTQINARLNATVRTLRLPALLQALAGIRDTLSRPGLDPQKIRQFEAGVTALDGLNAELTALSDSHERWQTLDLELRRIETTLEQDTAELALSWPDLKAMVAPLCPDPAEQWVISLQEDGAKLEGALQAADQNKIKQSFRRYRRQASDRFYRVDVELKRTCDDLRKIVDPLASVLRMIA